MPDARFFELLGPLRLGDIAEATGARLGDSADPDRPIHRPAPLHRAESQDIAFLSDSKRASELAGTRAGAVFVSEAFADRVPKGCAAVLSERPQAAWARASAQLVRPRRHDGSAGLIHPGAVIETGAVLGPGVIVGPDVRIGAGTVIASAAVIGPGVCIGRDCEIGAFASVTFALLGDRVKILAGARIGESGFGVAAAETGAIDIPQLGRVILQDGVTIGANSCVDRGAWDDTVIGENTKLDNLVQIGHNVRMGRNCAAAAFVGISGSCVIGDGVQFGGRVGMRDHISVGDGARLAAGSGVLKDIPAGETWVGYPAKPVRQWKREEATLRRLAAQRGGDEA